MSSINSRVPPLRLMAVDTPTDGQIAAYQSSSGKFEWVDESSGGSPGGSSGSIQYNDGAGGFAGSTKMIYDDTNAKITLTSGGNTTFIDAAGSPQLKFDGTGSGNIPTIAGDGSEAGGTGLLLLGNNTVSNNYMWFNSSSSQIQIISPSSSESIKINSNNGGNIEITATSGSHDVILSAASGNVKIEGLSYPTSDGTNGQVIQTNGSGVLSFTDAPSTSPGGSDGDFQINNSGSFGGSILSTNKTTTMTLNSGASGDPQLQMTSSTKSITLTVDTNNKLKVEGALYSWELDASSASGGLTFPDGTTQTTAASGGGSTLITPEFPALDSQSMPSECLGFTHEFSPPSSVVTNRWANTSTRIRPHILQQSGTLEKARFWIAGPPTGTDNQDFTMALWNADTNGGIGTLKCQATFTITPTDSAGIVESAWAAETGEDLSISIGDIVWVGFYGIYGASSTATNVYWIRMDALTVLVRKDDGSTSYNRNEVRFYSSTGGSPSSLGDNPTLDRADGGSSTGASAWPFMWYTAS